MSLPDLPEPRELPAEIPSERVSFQLMDLDLDEDEDEEDSSYVALIDRIDFLSGEAMVFQPVVTTTTNAPTSSAYQATGLSSRFEVAASATQDDRAEPQFIWQIVI